MFRLLDKIAFCIFFRTSFDRSVLTSLYFRIPTKNIYYDVYLLYFIAWILLFQFPPKWCILPCLLFFLCSSICYPWAAHLQQKNLLSYFVHDTRINPVSSYFCVLREDKDIPVRCDGVILGYLVGVLLLLLLLFLLLLQIFI